MGVQWPDHAQGSEAKPPEGGTGAQPPVRGSISKKDLNTILQQSLDFCTKSEELTTMQIFEKSYHNLKHSINISLCCIITELNGKWLSKIRVFNFLTYENLGNI